jgi:DNA replication protein
MKLFSGFPAGKLQVTPLPNLFFAELCPAIDDLGELKLTLHLFWLLGTRKSRTLYVSESELRADHTLMQSLAAMGHPWEETLERSLTLACERGTLLHASVAEDNVYFLNSESGRRAYTRLTQGEETYVAGTKNPEPATAGARSDIFDLYEKNVGLLTPMLVEELKEAEKEYPPEWIVDAFKIAVENNKRSWSYTRKILERWKAEGRGDATKKAKTWYGDEYGKFVKR